MHMHMHIVSASASARCVQESPTHTSELTRARVRRAMADGIEIKPAHGKGLGVFATAPLRAGDRVIAEQPLLSRSVDAMRGEAAAGHIEEAMTAAVASLGAAEQRAFYALCTADGRSPSAHGIWLSNAYLTDKRPEMRAGIFEIVPMAWLQVLVAKCGSVPTFVRIAHDR